MVNWQNYHFLQFLSAMGICSKRNEICVSTMGDTNEMFSSLFTPRAYPASKFDIIPPKTVLLAIEPRMFFCPKSIFWNSNWVPPDGRREFVPKTHALKFEPVTSGWKDDVFCSKNLYFRILTLGHLMTGYFAFQKTIQCSPSFFPRRRQVSFSPFWFCIMFLSLSI